MKTETHNWRRRPNTVFNSLIYSYLICRNRHAYDAQSSLQLDPNITLFYFLKSNQHVYMIARKKYSYHRHDWQSLFFLWYHTFWDIE